MTSIDAVLRAAASRLREAGIESPGLEARLLLGHALGLDQAGLLRDRTAAIDPAAADALVARRAAREPLAHIIGRREFWSLEFAVSAATLVPRPDSETLIEAALAALPDRALVRRVLDLGTGSGCLLVAALTEFPAAFGVGTDRSAEAASVAAANAARLVPGRAAILCADWAAPLAGRFDLVLCNPPYIAQRDLDGLMAEVARFEPRLALDGGADGLDAYRRIIPALPALARVAVIELGAGQHAAVAAIAGAAGLSVAVRADLAGIPRALVLS